MPGVYGLDHGYPTIRLETCIRRDPGHKLAKKELGFRSLSFEILGSFDTKGGGVL